MPSILHYKFNFFISPNCRCCTYCWWIIIEKLQLMTVRFACSNERNKAKTSHLYEGESGLRLVSRRAHRLWMNNIYLRSKRSCFVALQRILDACATVGEKMHSPNRTSAKFCRYFAKMSRSRIACSRNIFRRTFHTGYIIHGIPRELESRSYLLTGLRLSAKPRNRAEEEFNLMANIVRHASHIFTVAIFFLTSLRYVAYFRGGFTVPLPNKTCIKPLCFLTAIRDSSLQFAIAMRGSAFRSFSAPRSRN